MYDVRTFVHALPLERAQGASTVRILRVGHDYYVVAECSRCGARVMPPFPVSSGSSSGSSSGAGETITEAVTETIAVRAASMIAADAQRRCGTADEAPGCAEKRANLAEPVGRNRPRHLRRDRMRLSAVDRVCRPCAPGRSRPT